MTAFGGEPFGATRGRFWSLRDSAGDCEESDGDPQEVSEDIDEDVASTSSYLLDACRSPPSVNPRQIVEEPSSRIQKRIQRRLDQRAAAVSIKVRSPRFSPSFIPFAGQLQGQSSATDVWARRPPIEPSTFCLEEEMDAATWTLVERRKKLDLRGRRRSSQRRRTSLVKFQNRGSFSSLQKIRLYCDQRIMTRSSCTSGSTAPIRGPKSVDQADLPRLIHKAQPYSER
jgi:hypothetical protein